MDQTVHLHVCKFIHAKTEKTEKKWIFSGMRIHSWKIPFFSQFFSGMKSYVWNNVGLLAFFRNELTHENVTSGPSYLWPYLNFRLCVTGLKSRLNNNLYFRDYLQWFFLMKMGRFLIVKNRKLCKLSVSKIGGLSLFGELNLLCLFHPSGKKVTVLITGKSCQALCTMRLVNHRKVAQRARAGPELSKSDHL